MFSFFSFIVSVYRVRCFANVNDFVYAMNMFVVVYDVCYVSKKYMIVVMIVVFVSVFVLCWIVCCM